MITICGPGSGVNTTSNLTRTPLAGLNTPAWVAIGILKVRQTPCKPTLTGGLLGVVLVVIGEVVANY
jgi:hypothetical protein